MIGEYTQENMRVDSVLQVMKDRSLRQWGLDHPKGVLGTRQRHVHQPRLAGGEIRAVRPEQVTPVQQLGLGSLLGIRLMAEFPGALVIRDRVRRAVSGNLPKHGVMLLYRAARDASRIFSLAHGGQATWKAPQTRSTPCFVRVRDD